MSAMMTTLETIVERLRRLNTDVTNVEVKSGRGGLSASIVETICAFANLPGGGTLIIGLDERSGFRPSGLAADRAAEMAGTIVRKAREALEPAVQVTAGVEQLEDSHVVVAAITEVPRSHKPCRVRATHAAYLRFWDGDFQLSELEQQGFLANRDQPRFDLAAIGEATITDLSPGEIERFCRMVRRSGRAYDALSDEHVLLKTGVIDRRGFPTVAGILALAEVPQQWLPNATIQAAVIPQTDDRGEVRARDAARFDGPIPLMLQGATEWVMRQLPRDLNETTSGDVRSEHRLPEVAVREIIANALVHRDLAPWALTRAVEIRVRGTRLTVTNPGGLFGITVDRLGHDDVSSARNSTLLRICQHLQRVDGAGVVEALASGIPTVFAAMSERHLAAPRFFDQAIRFTAELDWAPVSIGGTVADGVLALLAAGTRSAGSLADELAVTPVAVRKALLALRRKGLVEQLGGRGSRNTVYRRADR